MGWNIRGMNHAKKKGEILRLLTKFDIDIMGILETKIKRRRQTPMRIFLAPNWKSISNSETVDEVNGS